MARRRSCVWLVGVWGLMLAVGCGDTEAAKTSPDGSSERDAPALATPEPSPAPSTRFDDGTGEVSANDPDPSRYSCEGVFEPKPSETWVVKCRLRDEAFFLLMAKEFVSDQAASKSLGTLAAEFPATFRLMFERYQVATTQPGTWHGIPAVHSDIAAKHERWGNITKRETIFKAHDRVYVISAEGQPVPFSTALKAGEIDRWFDEVGFASLKHDPNPEP